MLDATVPLTSSAVNAMKRSSRMASAALPPSATGSRLTSPNGVRLATSAPRGGRLGGPAGPAGNIADGVGEGLPASTLCSVVGVAVALTAWVGVGDGGRV